MFNLIPLLRVISAIAISYAIFVTLALFAYWNIVDSPNLWASIKVALAGAFVLDVALFAAVHVWWKWLWAKFPALNNLLFPNLNGQWRMKIYWVSDKGDGVANASATIKHLHQTGGKLALEAVMERIGIRLSRHVTALWGKRQVQRLRHCAHAVRGPIP